MKKFAWVTKIYYLCLAMMAVAVSLVLAAPVARADTTTLEKLPDNTDYHDFVVGPGKIELQLSPGQSQTIDLTVANRLGSDKVFSISEEDFKGSDDPNQPIVLLGSDRGPYSLKDDISIPTTTLAIPFGYKAHIPITVTAPSNSQPGALYGSVLVSVVSSPGTTTSSGVGATNPIITRIGTLFFVRIPGTVEADGQLTGFSLANGSIVWSGSLTKTSPILFNLLFKNSGDVYLAPSGTLSVTNILGSTIAKVTIDPWFAMPQSLRFRQVEWDPTFLFGRYVAHVSVNRGYGDSVDTSDVVFWVIPWEMIIIVFIGLAILIAFVRWVLSKFTIVSRK